jgi:hypothetical protein
MKDPTSKASKRSFELLKNEARAFSKSTMGVGIDLPAWLATLENEVHQYLLPFRLADLENPNPAGEPVPIPIADLREKLEQLPRREN